ncbi:MAG: PorT family protein [Bacteroidetes bacterium]|nr:PorT family protein [Bacteroidota bacterium]
MTHRPTNPLHVYFLLWALCCAVQPARAQIGVTAGLNFDQVTDLVASGEDVMLEQASGFHVGLFADWSLGPVAIRPAVIVRQSTGLPLSLMGSRTTFDVTTVEIPLDLRVTLVPLPVIKPYVLAGPKLGMNWSATTGFADAIERLTMGADVGMGVEVRIPGIDMKLLPELRVGVGLSNFITGDFVVDGVSFTPDSEGTLQTIQLRLGIAF